METEDEADGTPLGGLAAGFVLQAHGGAVGQVRLPGRG